MAIAKRQPTTPMSHDLGVTGVFSRRSVSPEKTKKKKAAKKLKEFKYFFSPEAKASWTAAAHPIAG